ncbi:sensor histidine kinase [Maricaulis sp. MIT060901]|uniref:sensor histidine kinase n=1 Tax=Maricaulis sp. MIT060901 TaxID=3096993 RepID=UPI003999A89E
MNFRADTSTTLKALAPVLLALAAALVIAVMNTSWLLALVAALVGIGGVIAVLMALGRGENGKAAREQSDLIEKYALELERSNQDLQVFASAASHDLQEPLRKIESFGQRLHDKYDDVLDETGRTYLHRMVDASGRMRRLIDALLTFARVNDSNTSIADVDLEALWKSVLTDNSARIKSLKARIDVTELPVVEADETQMRIIFSNLLNNALKYQPDGQVPEVSVEYFEPEDEEMVGIRVRDNGIGFDAKYSERIFQMFERLHSRSEFEGSGIGLATCAKITERHGGSLTAQSNPGQGAEFSLILPKYQ